MDGNDAKDNLSQALEYRNSLRHEVVFDSTWDQELEGGGQPTSVTARWLAVVAHQAQDEVQCSVGSTHKGVAHIEHYFGVLKLKWGILLDLPNYPMLK
jgi:hypothetical protein